ncbi:hypothetical protein AN958_05019 [Leucoagaricus sp. SymC.cos]|nr:hypothetical protein AN958_05019 [Leucoagaricus sp. SymC.cos]
MRLSLTLVALSSLVSFATATYVKPSGSNCKANEFWWNAKSCCLPHGGVPSPPPPPKGSSCPPSNYYWSNDKGSCVPRYPPHDNEPEPQCDKDSDWYKALYQCLPKPHPPSQTTTHKPSATPTSPTYPHPTGGYGNGGGNGGTDNGHGYGNSGSDNGHGYGNGGDDDSHGYGNGGSNQGWYRRRRALKPVVA